MRLQQSNKGALLRLISEGQPMSLKQQLSLTFALGLPTILANISAIVMQFIDAAMVGQLGADDSASVGLMGTTNWLFEGVLSAFAAGYAVQVAHLLGAKRKADAQKARQQKAQREAGSKTNKSNKTASLMNSSSSSKLSQSQRNDSIRNAQYKGRKTNKSSADND